MKRNENYTLPRERYAELRRVCLSYWECKMKIQEVLQAGRKISDGSRPVGLVSAPTERAALKLCEVDDVCVIIEQTVREVCADYDTSAKSRHLLPVSDFLLYNVTDFFKLNSFYSIKRLGYNLAICRNKFYELRRKFFWELDKKI